VAVFVNEAIRTRENRENMRKMGKKYPVLNEVWHRRSAGQKIIAEGCSFVPPVPNQPSRFNPKRVFLKEGLLTKICRKAHKKYVFVCFNDLLMYKGELDVKTKPRYAPGRNFRPRLDGRY
jgi:hypothetical protein